MNTKKRSFKKEFLVVMGNIRYNNLAFTILWGSLVFITSDRVAFLPHSEKGVWLIMMLIAMLGVHKSITDGLFDNQNYKKESELLREVPA